MKFWTNRVLHLLCLTAFCSLMGGVSRVEAASQTWSNAPTDAIWNDPINWIGNAVPGAVNSATSTDVATFKSPLFGGIGGADNPILNDLQRGVRGLLFDTAGCGAFVFGNSLNDNSLELNNNGPSTGNVTITSTVTNPIVFRQGFSFRGPSSQNYTYAFTNNAVSAEAALYIAAITNNANSTTRPWAITLGGSNAGTNTFALIDDRTALGTQNGAILLDKFGTGRWILSGANDLPQKISNTLNAHVFVNAGTLEVQNAASLGAITMPNLVVTNGTLQIDGVTLNNNGVTLRNNGTIRMNGSGTLNAVNVGNAGATVVTLATTGAGDMFTIGTNANTLTGGISDTSVHVNGPGTVVLPFAANYLGKWSLDSGTIQIGNPSALGNGSLTMIAAGATLDFSSLGAVTVAPSTTSIGGAGTGTTDGSMAATIKADPGATIDLTSKGISLIYAPAASNGDMSHPALYVSQGALSLGGNTFSINNASGMPLSAGTYRLIQQAGGNVADGGGYAVNVIGSGLAAGTVAAIQISGGDVDLMVTIYVPKDLVWTGGNPDATWDTGVTPNFINGTAPSIFLASDSVTFNPVGSTNPTVNLSGTLSPGNVTVDTSVNDYIFTGTGQIGGSGGLTKTSNGTLLLQTANNYLGATVVNGGILRVGANNAIPGSSSLAVSGSGTLDLNSFNNVIGGLSENGIVDNQAGGNSMLTVGNNDTDGTFSGVIRNSSGTLGLTKTGTGLEILAGPNTYSGATVINNGVLRLANFNALGSGGSALTINNGNLDLSTSAAVASVSGSGTIANNSSLSTNTLVIQGTSTYNGLISDGTGGGAVRVLVHGGTFRVNANNTYSGGTVLANGAGLAFGNVGQVGSGGVMASNNSIISMPVNNIPSPAVAASFTTVDGATVTFTSVNAANAYSGQFFGSETATNVFAGGNMSLNGSNMFANFFGTVIVTNGQVRFGAGGTAPQNNVFGGDNTTFDFVGTGGCFHRDAAVVKLGALLGDGQITGPTVSSPGNYWIGAKGIDTVFSGGISGANNLVKTGVGKLTLNGTVITTNTDNATFTNLLYSDSLITYTGTTTVSNGTLALVVPSSLVNSPTITLAGSNAVLDASKMGYVSNFSDINGPNSFLVTNGVFALQSGQTLDGLGTLIASNITADSSTTINVGLSSNIFGNLIVNGVFASDGAVNLKVSHSGSAVSDKLTATNLVLNGSITVTQSGTNDLITGDVFTLFNGPVTGLATNAVILPAQNFNGTIAYVWTNKLAIDGTIGLLEGAASPVNSNPTNLVFVASGGQVTLSWPADHIGWRLQAETNSLSLGLAGNWVEVAGASATNRVIMPVDKSNGTVFFRLIYP